MSNIETPLSRNETTQPAGLAALVTLSTATLLAALGTSSANVALPDLAVAFGASFQEVQWVVLGYLLSVTALVVSAGRLGDGFGRRKLMIIGVLLFTLGSAACGASHSLPQLVAARVVQGAGAAMMMALAMALAGDALPKEKAGSAIGLLGTMSAVGTALGPTLGGALIQKTGWQAIFLINVPAGLVLVVFALRSIPKREAAASSMAVRFDFLGATLLSLTLVAYALSLTYGRGSWTKLNSALLLTALAGSALFVASQRAAEAPLVRLSAFRDANLTSGFVTSVLVTSVVMATLVVGPFYLSGALMLDAAGVGLSMSVGPVIAALAGYPAGRFVDRIGSDRVVLFGLLAAAAGAMFLATLPPLAGLPGYIGSLALLTAGYAAFQAANNAGVMAAGGSAQRGVYSGLLNLSRNLGLITGASAMGAVFSWGSGAQLITPGDADAVTAGLRMTFVIAALLIVLATAIHWFTRRTGAEPA